MKPPATGLLGDTAARDYSGKLKQFNAFAQPELRAAMASLRLQPGMRVLDAGCGTGEALGWLADAVGKDGAVIGMELAAAHATMARATAAPSALVLQADLMKAPLRSGAFDLIWSVNTINHLRDPLAGMRSLAALLRPRGRIALGQSSLLPDMLFAWDARLERLTTDAVRQYYRDRYGLSELDLAAVRSLVGWLHGAELANVSVRTSTLERIWPLDAASENYLRDVIFRDTWGERLRPYLSAQDYDQLARLCDPHSPEYALRRPDLHVVQTFTLAVAEIPR
ncbi:MAG: class I SAM-dependent methyltransferase [Steroidobacterales bacterium]